jgi:hypothetical protein
LMARRSKHRSQCHSHFVVQQRAHWSLYLWKNPRTRSSSSASRHHRASIHINFSRRWRTRLLRFSLIYNPIFAPYRMQKRLWTRRRSTFNLPIHKHTNIDHLALAVLRIISNPQSLFFCLYRYHLPPPITTPSDSLDAPGDRLKSVSTILNNFNRAS